MHLTHKPMPLHDPCIGLLSDKDRVEVAQFWLNRAGGEWESTRAFRWMEEACLAIGATPEVLAMVRRAIDDEARHGELCQLVASTYHGHPLEPVLSPDIALPLRCPDDPVLEVALYFAESCCLGEVVGAVTIESSFRAATAPLARAALRELLTDEVVHAQMGFAYLSAYLRPQHKEALAGWLPVLLQDAIARWQELGDIATPSALTAHGCLSFERLEEMMLTAFSDISLPGFAHLGLDTRQATEHLARASRELRRERT